MATLTICRGVSGTVIDNFMLSESPTTQAGTSDNINIYRLGATYHNGIVHFDLSGLPAGAVVSSATLKFYIKAVSGAHTSYGYRILDANNGWGETTTDWNHRVVASTTDWAGGHTGCGTSGTDRSATAIATISVPTLGAYTTTLDATEFASMRASNNGMVFISPDGVYHVPYSSDVGADPGTYRPKMVITYTEPPIPTSCSPSSGVTKGATSVTITGSKFAGATTVTFGTVAATSVSVVSDTSITCVTPAHAAGAVDIVVTTGEGDGTLTNGYTYYSPAPTTCTPNTGVTSGATSVTIAGQWFTGATTVTFGGTSATSISVVSDTSITCVTPAKAAGAVDVVVGNGTSTGTITNGFTYVSPTLSSCTPNSGVNTGGDAITNLAGTYLTGVTGVTFGGDAATSVVVVSSIKITCVTPAHAVGLVDVVASNGTTTGTLTNGFTYVAYPIVTSIAPVEGSVNGLTPIIITGENFTGTTSVLLGGKSIPFSVTDDTHIAATALYNSPGTAPCIVTNTAGSVTGNGLYTYKSHPGTFLGI